jgi:hypothetical protein
MDEAVTKIVSRVLESLPAISSRSTSKSISDNITKFPLWMALMIGASRIGPDDRVRDLDLDLDDDRDIGSPTLPE